MNHFLLSLILTLGPLCLDGQILRPIVTGAPSSGPTSTPWVTGVTPGTPRNDFAGCTGADFTPTADLVVTSLGRYMWSGDTASHTLYILDFSTPFSTITSVSVNMTGGTIGQFVYGSVTPVTLTSGHKYSIVSSESIGGDTFGNDTDTVINSTTADAADFSSVYVATCPGAQNENTSGNHRTYGPSNFLYHLT